MARDAAQSAREARSKRFTRVRVGVLLCVLALVSMWAWSDIRSRRRRTDWQRTLVVALVVVRDGTVPAEVLRDLEQRVAALQDRLQAEFARYRPNAAPPFTLVAAGPIALPEPVPHPAGTGVTDLARFNYALWSFARAVDGRAKVDASAADARIYLVVRPPHERTRQWVEGLGQQGGRIGLVEVEISPSMVDFALFVATHELLHTLGATDKYDETGQLLVPDGLADPELEPRYPQPRAEVMARLRAVSASEAVPPESLDQLAVGPATAREIGWLR